MKPAVGLAAALLAGAAGAGASLAAADSFTPVRLAVHAPRIARLHRPLRVRVDVSADPGVLDVRTASLRLEVELAGECGGELAHTRGTVLLNRVLRPQPQTGRAYRVSVRGTGRPSRTGAQTVCVWLAENGDGRIFASSQSTIVEVRRR